MKNKYVTIPLGRPRWVSEAQGPKMSLTGTNPLTQHVRHSRKPSFLVNSGSAESSLQSQAMRRPYARVEDAEASTKPLEAPSATRADERITTYFYLIARGQLHPGTSERSYFWTLHAIKCTPILKAILLAERWSYFLLQKTQGIIRREVRRKLCLCR